jgi:hypothetical protein
MTEDQKLVAALERAKTFAEIEATGVTGKKLGQLIAGKQIGDMTARRLTHMIETDANGFWLPRETKSLSEELASQPSAAPKPPSLLE